MCASADEYGWLTVMEAVPMYHVCSFHKRLQAQLIPFRFRNTGKEKKINKDWDEFLENSQRGATHTIKTFRWKRKKEKRQWELKKKKIPCRCATTINHQFHIKPETVLNTRPISIQTIPIPFGALDALKGLIVPSSALSLIAPPLRSSFGGYHGQPCFVLLGPCIRRGDPSGACKTTRHSSLQRLLSTLFALRKTNNPPGKQEEATRRELSEISVAIHVLGSSVLFWEPPLRVRFYQVESPPQPAGVNVWSPSFSSSSSSSSSSCRASSSATAVQCATVLTHASETSSPGRDFIHSP